VSVVGVLVFLLSFGFLWVFSLFLVLLFWCPLYTSCMLMGALRLF
jgi:hypothetical protein